MARRQLQCNSPHWNSPFNFISVCRTVRRGGGVAALFKDVYQCKQVSFGQYLSFEYLGIVLKGAPRILFIKIFSTQDLTPWGQNDHKNCEQKSQNHTGGPSEWPAESWDQSNKGYHQYTLRRQGLKSCSARRVPLLKPVHVQAHLKCAREHLDDPEEDWENVIWSDETKI